MTNLLDATTLPPAEAVRTSAAASA